MKAANKHGPEPNLPKDHPFYEWKKAMLNEITFGGSEPPCPFCKHPRVRRSDHIRCVRCLVNWSEGEALDKDPRMERLNQFLEKARASAPRKGPQSEEGGEEKSHARR
jgi:hypothetical protein